MKSHADVAIYRKRELMRRHQVSDISRHSQSLYSGGKGAREEGLLNYMKISQEDNATKLTSFPFYLRTVLRAKRAVSFALAFVERYIAGIWYRAFYFFQSDFSGAMGVDQRG